MKEKSIWVVALAGKHVFHKYSLQGVVESISNIDAIRNRIKERCNIEFESDDDAVQYHPESYRSYRNISDNRDITLVVERTTLYSNTSDEHIVLLTDACYRDTRHFVICQSLDEARKTARNYEKTRKFYSEIYEKGEDLR